MVCAGILILRKTRPDIPRPFKTPFVPVVPILGIIFSLMQMISLPVDTWLRLVIWMALGFIIYFVYSKPNAARHNAAIAAAGETALPPDQELPE
jgi:APA family basic amino acid/polyamine antiporter